MAERHALHAVDDAPDADAKVAAVHALVQTWDAEGCVHDVDVSLMALHASMASAHPGVTRATFDALHRLVDIALPQFSTRNMQTLVKTCVPTALERAPEVEAARSWLLRVHAAVHKDVLGSERMRHGDTPVSMWERAVRDAMEAVSPRVREAALRLASETSTPVDAVQSQLVACVQDADEGVRSAAKSTIGALYGKADPAQVSDMLAALSDAHIHSATLDEIKTALGREDEPKNMNEPGRAPEVPGYATAEDMQSRAMPKLPEWAIVPDDVRPIYVLSRYDVDSAFTTQAFSGKETEGNWQAREKAVVHFRGMLKARIPDEFVHTFVAHIRGLQEGILKCVSSLRTTLAMHTIALIRQLALAFGPLLEHTMDAFFTSLLRMAGMTKKIVATASQVGVETILACVPMRHAYWHQLLAGLQDKSIATRVYMCKHVQVVWQVHGEKRAEMDGHHGIEMTRQCLARALDDPSFEVRTAARELFSTFHRFDQVDAEHMLTTLPPATRKQVAASMEHAAAPMSPRRPSSRAGPSRAVLAAKKAAMRQKQQDEAQHAHFEPERRLPRESVWHPSLLDGPDASTDLIGLDMPWRKQDAPVDVNEGDATLTLDGLHIDTGEGRREMRREHAPITPQRRAVQSEASTPQRADTFGQTPRSETLTPRGGTPLGSHIPMLRRTTSSIATPRAPPSLRRISSQATPLRAQAVVRTSLDQPPTAEAWFAAQCASTMHAYRESMHDTWDESVTQIEHTTQVDVSALCRVVHELDAAHEVQASDMARLLKGLERFIDAPPAPDDDLSRWLLMLGVAQRLAANCKDTEEERVILALVLRVPFTRPAHTTLAMGAARAILDAWASGTRSTRPCTMLVSAESVLHGNDNDHALRLVLVLHALERVLSRLDAVAVDDELRATVPLVHRTLRHPQTPVRRACVAFLVHAYTRVDNREKFLRMYAPLSAGEERLIQHYMP